MIYLDSFHFCNEDRGVYPYRVLAPKQLDELTFEPITIFYGSNGSGKSTALNVIASAINLPNMTQGNFNEYFKGYVKRCSFELNDEIPQLSRFVRSEDIMDSITRVRKQTMKVNKAVAFTETEMDEEDDPQLLAKLFDPDSMTNDERFFLSRLDSARPAFESMFQCPDQFSNGETAIDFFNNELLAESIYFLDEPENSLAPALQMELAHKLELLAHYLDCQIIVATHSPFFLSMRDAKIIDLDSSPTVERKWWELPSMKVYYDLFSKNAKHFEKK